MLADMDPWEGAGIMEGLLQPTGVCSQPNLKSKRQNQDEGRWRGMSCEGQPGQEA